MDHASDIDRRYHVFLLVTGVAILIWSGVHPRHRGTWVLEVTPAVVGAILLLATYHRFRFTNLAYLMVWIHAVILMIGGHWTYSEMPLFNWLRDELQLQRNNFDRLGHLAQGFFPAILVRELLLRTSRLRLGKWLFFLVVACCLAISAAYELIEWTAALLLGEGADQFLATQGDPWDTQWDMLLALIGALASLVLLGRSHDRALQRLGIDSRLASRR